MKVGVLALQGAFEEHIEMLNKLDVKGIKVRRNEDLDNIDGLIIPGGESTVMAKLISDFEMGEKLASKILNEKLPVFGTCAGLIMLSNIVDGRKNSILPAINIKTKRNAYGRQLGSFRRKKIINSINKPEFEHVFIRAPYIEEVGEGVEVLSVIDDKIVASRQENVLVTAFHPELTNDSRMHRYFIDKVIKAD